MPRQKNGINKSEEIRQVLESNPQMTVKEIVSSLGEKGIKVQPNLVYFIKGKIKGRRGRRKKVRQMVANVAATGNSDPVATILKVKRWAVDSIPQRRAGAEVNLTLLHPPGAFQAQRSPRVSSYPLSRSHSLRFLGAACA